MIVIMISKFFGKLEVIINEKSIVGNIVGWFLEFVELLLGKDEFIFMLGFCFVF